MTHRLFSRSAWMPCVHTNRSPGGSPGRHSFHEPPGNGRNPPSAVASPTEGVGTSVPRGKLAKSRPSGEIAALVIMTLPDDATVISSMALPRHQTLPQREPPPGRMPEGRLGPDRGELQRPIALSRRRDASIPALEHLLHPTPIVVERAAQEPRNAPARVDRPIEPQQRARVRARVDPPVTPAQLDLRIGRVNRQLRHPARQRAE